MASISTDELSKALATLNEALELFDGAGKGTPEAKAFRDACLQRLKYVFELSWKGGSPLNL